MPAPLELLPKFAPIVARHFSAYLDLFADEAAELGTRMARRMVATLIAVLALSFAIAMACVWILSAVWDTPWRNFSIAGLFAVFAIATAIAWTSANRRLQQEGSPFHRLRAEWTLDEQLIAELLEGKPEEAAVEQVKTPRPATVKPVSQPVKDYVA